MFKSEPPYFIRATHTFCSVRECFNCSSFFTQTNNEERKSKWLDIYLCRLADVLSRGEAEAKASAQVHFTAHPELAQDLSRVWMREVREHVQQKEDSNLARLLAYSAGSGRGWKLLLAIEAILKGSVAGEESVFFCNEFVDLLTGLYQASLCGLIIPGAKNFIFAFRC